MKKPWERQESRLAHLIDGQRQPGSGNGWARKADVRNKGWLVEAKATKYKSFILKVAELRKLAHHADVEGRTPAFCIEIDGDNYVVLREQDWDRGDG